ncbi:MAG: alpha/beta hydrolase [Xanthobacteraceae bacterium]|nr:MAG: alpha/beta hydrolase [Xanthobacteraceae bacterium]
MAIDLEAEYNNRARVPGHPAIIASWAREAAAFRAEAQAGGAARLGVAYGPSPRQTLDLFGTSREGAPLAVFFHGGYWQALDPSFFSHMAKGANAHGLAMAVAGYDLCPEVRVGAIIDEARRACAFLWRNYRRRLVVAGHSAGGHLAACLVATDWSMVGPDLPADLVPAGLAISGLFDLTPLIATSINDRLHLDEDEACAASPLFWEVAPGRALEAWVGGAESGEYLRQSRAIVEAWGRRGVATRFAEVNGADHFTMIAGLADRASAMTAALIALAGRAPPPPGAQSRPGAPH